MAYQMTRPSHQLQNRIATDGDISRDDARVINEIGDRRGEDGVLTRNLPLLLQHDGKRTPMLLPCIQILAPFASADHDHVQLRIFQVKLLQLWRQRVAGAAVRAGEDQKYWPATQFGQ